MNLDEFKTNCQITWCPGCGNFAVFSALKKALLELKLKPSDVLVVYGIGCHGHMVNYLKTFGFDGRALPVATGAKLANKNLTVIVIAGDGDQLGEGGNHLIHAAKRNTDITCLLHNNQLYALTVGQSSPTSEKSFKSRSAPKGVQEEPLNSVALALAANSSFVARAFAGNVRNLTKIFVEAIKHKGFSFVDILQPCVTLNYLNTYNYFYPKVYDINEANFDFKNKASAFEKSFEWGEKIPIGIFYKKERETFEEFFPQTKEKPLGKVDIENINIDNLLKEFS